MHMFSHNGILSNHNGMRHFLLTENHMKSCTKEAAFIDIQLVLLRMKTSL
jgi:hypothetical protein